jgi:hypothetical protein
MSPIVKILIGLSVALAAGWLAHGPLGRGEALIGELQAQADAAVAKAELPGVKVELGRDPLSRSATLSGPANDIQREGMGGQFGVKDHVRAVPGIAAVRWDDEPARRTFPLLAETLLLAAGAWALGMLLGGVIARRRRPQSYLD